MAENSKIEWTDTTWNPVTGCTPVSHGCTRTLATPSGVMPGCKARAGRLLDGREWNEFPEAIR